MLITCKRIIVCLLGVQCSAGAAVAQEKLTIDHSPGPHICWIDRVRIEGDGVRVVFSDSAWNLMGGAGPSRGQFLIGHGDIQWLDGPSKDRREPGLLLSKGEDASIWQTPEDTCEISFMKVDGRAGIVAHASFHPPYLTGSETALFIPGQELPK